MTERIIIEGDRARVVREQLVAETPLATLAPHLVTRIPTVFPILPQNAVRYISYDPEHERGSLLAEVKPKKTTMRFDDSSVRTVALPYQYFGFAFQFRLGPNQELGHFTIIRDFLMWAREPIRDLDSTVVSATCPNVDEGGGICWGSTSSESSSLAARIDDLINNFYATEFNEDLGLNTPYGNDYDGLATWEEESSHPLCFLDWDIWEGRTNIRIGDIAQWFYDHTERPPMAQINPAFVDIPPLPENFTVARAREWLDSLDDGARRRIITATSLLLTPEPTSEVEA